MVSDRAVKNAENRFELIEKNIGYFFNDTERDALTLKDSLYMLRKEDEIIRAVLLKMESMPYLDTIGLVLDNGKYL
ncbi:CHASE9 sensor domain-containing protein, partial [Escherichia coli]